MYTLLIFCVWFHFDLKGHFSVICLHSGSLHLFSVGFNILLLSLFFFNTICRGNNQGYPGELKILVGCEFKKDSLYSRLVFVFYSNPKWSLSGWCIHCTVAGASALQQNPFQTFMVKTVFILYLFSFLLVFMFDHKAIFWAISLNVQCSAVPVEIVANYNLILFVNCCCISGV